MVWTLPNRNTRTPWSISVAEINWCAYAKIPWVQTSLHLPAHSFVQRAQHWSFLPLLPLWSYLGMLLSAFLLPELANASCAACFHPADAGLPSCCFSGLVSLLEGCCRGSCFQHTTSQSIKPRLCRTPPLLGSCSGLHPVINPEERIANAEILAGSL